MESEKFFREIAAFLLFLASLFLAFSFISYHPDDPSLFNSTAAAAPIHNWFGQLGASVASLFFQLFGITAFLYPILLVVFLIRLMIRKEITFPILRAMGFLLMALFLPPLVTVPIKTLSWRGKIISSGGWIGRSLEHSLVGLFNVVGTTIILTFLVLLGLFFFAFIAPSDLFRTFTGFFSGIHRWLKGEMHEAKAKKRRSRIIEDRYEKLKEEGVIVTKREGEASLRVKRRKGVSAKASRSKRKEQRGVGEQKQLTLTPPAGAAYVLPPVALLDENPQVRAEDARQIVKLGRIIESKLAEFQVNGEVVGRNPGPVVTVFEFKPAPGVKFSKIVSYQDDLALALQTLSIRIERIPNKSTVGIEVPNATRRIIRLRDIIDSDAFTSSSSLLTLAMGVNIQGVPTVSDLTSMPHLLIGGTTGSGKSVGLNAMIMSILFKATPDEVKFIMVDPKRVEMRAYEHMPHLMVPIITSPKKAAQALAWAVSEMESRYREMAQVHARNIANYNRIARKNPSIKPFPYIVVVIDELADLLMVASKEVEDLIIRLAQMARAVGIHLILATQRPDKNVVTGLIKANIPARVAYQVSSGANSRVILDSIGAEKLLGMGDMLFVPPGTSRKVRLHGPFVSEVEIAKVVRYICGQKKPEFNEEVLRHPVPDRKRRPQVEGEEEVDDALYFEAVREVIQSQQASASHLQRRLRVGYARAARLVDLMESRGVVGPGKGSKPRDILVDEHFLEKLAEKFSG